jgi:glycosyltransferase involved in cell wall biosynthesis
MSILFSIIIPTYNRDYILRETLLSIQKQNVLDWELHLIDDGSTDNTKNLVKEFSIDKRIHYHYQKNSGPAVARNLGMRKATGEIITFVDSDDPVYPHYLEYGASALLSEPTKSYALSHCDFFYELYDVSGRLIARKSALESQSLDVSVQNIYNWDVRVAIGTGLFFKSYKFLNKVSWNPNIIPGDDIEFIMQLICLDPEGFIYIKKSLFEYRQKYGGDGVCSNTSYLQWALMFEKIYEIHKNDLFMTHPEAYVNRIKKYKQLQKQFDQKIAAPPKFKYFPEFWSES